MLRWAQTSTSMNHGKSKVTSRLLWVPRRVWEEKGGFFPCLISQSPLSLALGSVLAIFPLIQVRSSGLSGCSPKTPAHRHRSIKYTSWQVHVGPHTANNFKHRFCDKFKVLSAIPCQWEVLPGPLLLVFYHLIPHLSVPDSGNSNSPTFFSQAIQLPSSSIPLFTELTKAFHCPGPTLLSRHLVVPFYLFLLLLWIGIAALIRQGDFCWHLDYIFNTDK